MSSVSSIKLFLMSCIVALSLLPAETLYRCDFADGLQGWHGWPDGPGNDIDVSVTEQDGHKVLTLKGYGGWLTPIVALPEAVLCKKNAMIRFRIWSNGSNECDINLTNKEEQAMYSVCFALPANKWVEVQRRIDTSYHRLQGVPDIPNDGLVDDHISQIQIATQGTLVMMDCIEIVVADDDVNEYPPECRPLAQKNISPAEFMQKMRDENLFTKLNEFPCFQRNGFFPFAVVSRLDANAFNSKQLGEDLEASFTRDVVDMKRHYLNCYYDFCIGYGDLEQRIRRTEKTGMRIVECCFSGCDMFKAASDAPMIQAFQKVKDSPAILGWYGKDEPGFKELPTYLGNKKWFNENDPMHPFTSAICINSVRRVAGPLLEVIVPDIYSLRPGSPLDDPAPLLGHFASCRISRDETGGHRVWFMTQTFSNRHQNEGRKANFSSRYPTAMEIRLDMYATLAGGAHGISFFIYNDFIPYMGGIRSEKFDYTLVDPWGNGNAVYDEIADFGRRIVPIMPSLLDAEYDTELAVEYDKEKYLVGQYRNALGAYLFVVNRSTMNSVSSPLIIDMPKDCAAFSLVSRKKVDEASLSLPPAGGEILAVTTPACFEILRKEIQERVDRQNNDVARLRVAELEAAGFTAGTVTEAWLKAERELNEVQAAFGEMHQKMIRPEVVVKVDSAPEYEPLFSEIRSLSKRFFDLRAAHAKGSLPPDGALNELKRQIQSLVSELEQSLQHN